MVAASVVYPDLDNAELQDSYGVKRPEELLLEMVDDPGESFSAEVMWRNSHSRGLPFSSQSDSVGAYRSFSFSFLLALITYFEMQVTNEDKTSAAGRQTISLHGCLCEKFTLAKFQAGEELLEEESLSRFPSHRPLYAPSLLFQESAHP